MRTFLTYLSERCRWAFKRHRRSLWWVSLIVGATLAVLLWFYPQWVSRPHLGSNHALALVLVPLLAGASVFLVRWSFLLIQFYMQIRRELDTLTDAKKGGTSQSCPGLFRARRCDAKNNTVRSYCPSRAIRARTQIGSNEEVAEVCDLIFGRDYDHPFEGYPGTRARKRLAIFF